MTQTRNHPQRYDAIAEQIEAVLRTVSRPVALAGVLGMLAVAGVTVAAVILRWVGAGGIVAINEIVGMAFAVAVAATLPAATAQRVHLKIDLLGPVMGPRLRQWMELLGSLLLLLFLILLAREVQAYAGRMVSGGRTTTILGWPIGPFMQAVAVLFWATAAVQAVIAALDLVPALGGPGQVSGRTHPLVWLLLAATLAALTWAFWWGWSDFRGLSRAVTGAPSASVGLGFLLLWAALLLLMPVSAVMGLMGLLGTALFLGWRPAWSVLSSETASFLTNPQVAALPLFLLMGSFAMVAGLSDDVYRLARAVLGRLRGGLALATVGGCAGFGAVTGSSLATVATFGRISLPQMQAAGYAPHLAAGTVAAGGTLGALIPPSAPIILFALLTEASIGQLFIAAIIPGLLAAALYMLTIALVVRRDPAAVPDPAPRVPGERRAALAKAGPVTLLFGLVIGGLYTGVFTATESAAVGAIGAFLMAVWRGKLTRDQILKVMGETTAITAMIYMLIFGALTFSFSVGASQLPDTLTTWVGGLNLAPLLIIALLLVLYLLLGSVMDSFAVMIITVPIVTPLILGMGYDLIWWGIIMLVVVETGLITPPFGINLFVIRSVQPDMKLTTVFRGALPFVLSDFLRLALLVLFPALVLWLPMSM
ncbi:TRAP transporter large permease subunit [Natronohydrobacter thiooxidans]|uniref:TRAP transporter large permease n=1 Tax=Natronohydrobacter thiooxidans TaxID=87172 RepID=UPI000A000663|nr:TRAP transporter large permease [Natronohydrobacter thiooxidans]